MLKDQLFRDKQIQEFERLKSCQVFEEQMKSLQQKQNILKMHQISIQGQCDDLQYLSEQKVEEVAQMEQELKRKTQELNEQFENLNQQQRKLVQDQKSIADVIAQNELEKQKFQEKLKEVFNKDKEAQFQNIEYFQFKSDLEKMQSEISAKELQLREREH